MLGANFYTLTEEWPGIKDLANGTPNSRTGHINIYFLQPVTHVTHPLCVLLAGGRSERPECMPNHTEV